MSNSPQTRLSNAIALRDAAIALIDKNGVDEGSEGQRWFQRHTAENPEPRLAILFSTSLLAGQLSLNVWGTVRGKHVKALNISWAGEAVTLTAFRRGEWESELLAMVRATGAPVH